MERYTPKIVYVGSVPIGGSFPVSVQTMWKEPLTHISESLLLSIEELHRLGCDILRFAVPNEQSAHLLGELSRKVTIPLVADIHFNHRLALICMEYNIAKVRINPGNIGAKWKVKEVIGKAIDKNIPIRVGVNGGSLPPRLRENKDIAGAMVQAAEEEINILESLQFQDVIVSLKSSDVQTTVEANENFASNYTYPLHLGITEAGPLLAGLIKNGIGISRLLRKGLGSTIRVSLSDSCEKEIIAGREILSAENKLKSGIKIISCPRCGRASFDVHSFIQTLEHFLYTIDIDVTVAVMGCVVNGPGEARHADIGISGSNNGAVIFKKGKIVRKVNVDNATEEFRKELEDIITEKQQTT